MNCPTCGLELSLGDQYCSNCGSAVLTVEPIMDIFRKKDTSKYKPASEYHSNPKAKISFMLGLFAVVVLDIFGAVGLVAIIFGVIGYNTFDAETQINGWMPMVGIGLGAFSILRVILRLFT